MAQRKQPETSPVADSSVADDTILNDFRLDQSDLDRYVRMCFEGSVGAVKQLNETAKIHLDRLGVKTNRSKAVTKNPVDASANRNLQSLYRWMEKLNKPHKKAIAQLVALHATSCNRLGV